MIDGYTLPEPLHPEPGESLAGLIVRNASTFKFVDPRRLLSRIVPKSHLTLWSLCDTDPEGEFGVRLRVLLGLDEVTFCRMTPWTGNSTTQSVLGHPLWRQIARPKERAACPACMKASPFHRAIWSVPAMPVCAVHGTWLRRSCHCCGRPLTWFTRSVGCCSNFPACDGEIAEAPAEQANEETLRGIRSIHALLTRAPDAPKMPPGMEPQDILRLSFVLGQHALGLRQRASPSRFISLYRGRLPEILDAGWSALADWPNGFNRFLESVRAGTAGRPGGNGLRKAFGSLSTQVHVWAREPRVALVGEAFSNYVAGLGDLPVTAYALGRYAPGSVIEQRYLTATDAGRLLGVSLTTVDRIAQRRELYSLSSCGGAPSLIAADTCRALRAELDDSLLPSEARRELGIGLPMMMQFETAGLVRRSPAADLIMESRPYHRSEIRVFVAACRGNAPEFAADASAARNLSKLNALAANGRSASDICRALLDGRLACSLAVAGGRGLGALRFRLAEVEAALPTGKDTLSMVDAAGLLGTDHIYVSFWVKRGFLPSTEPSVAGELGLWVAREDVERFKCEFATSAILAEEIGQGRSTWIARHLAFLGVRPVSGKNVDGGGTNLFRRSDLPTDIASRIKRLQKGRAGSAQEIHRESFARVARAASAIGTEWQTTLTRNHNLFFDQGTKRAVQVVSGRRASISGVFRFKAYTTNLNKLKEFPEPWVALVPNEGNHFLLVPPGEVPWRGGRDEETRFASIHFNVDGRPQELLQWSRPIPNAAPAKATARSGYPPRQNDYKLSTAAGIEKVWGVKLERHRSLFTEVGGKRMVQVVPGKTEGQSVRQLFILRREAYDRLADCPDAWIALVPKGHTAFTLVRFGSLPWRPYAAITVQASVKIDAEGKPIM